MGRCTIHCLHVPRGPLSDVLEEFGADGRRNGVVKGELVLLVEGCAEDSESLLLAAAAAAVGTGAGPLQGQQQQQQPGSATGATDGAAAGEVASSSSSSALHHVHFLSC